VDVQGNTRIDTQTILSYFSLKAGDPFSEEQLNKALEKLFETGFFADVVAKREGHTIVLQVSENQIINQLAFEGNKAVEDKLLKEELGIRPRQVYTRARIQEAAQKIRDIYRFKGYIGAQVDPKLIQRDGGRVDVVFEINEGKPARVSRIAFVGNKRFSDSALRSVIMTKTSAWYRFLSTTDSYEPDRLAYDQELLQNHYSRNGYLDFQVLSMAAELSPDQKEFFITFSVSEGVRYDYGAVEVKSDLPGVDVAQLRTELLCEPSDHFNNLKVDKTAENMVVHLEKKGHYFLDVVPEIVPHPEKRTVDVLFRVVKRSPVYVNKILIEGNTSTDDAVIRRECRLAEGDAWSTAKVQRSKQRLMGLDFFEKLELKPLAQSKDRKDLEISVSEKQTGSLMGAVGYSSADGPLVELKAAERNFRGKGQEVELRGTVARRTQSAVFSFNEPYFMDRHLNAGWDFFISRARQDTRGGDRWGGGKEGYSQNDVGMSFKLGYEFRENWFQTWRYRITSERLSRITSPSPFIQAGKAVLSTIGHSLVYSTLDNVADPTEGYTAGVSNDFTGVGGTARYVTNNLNGSYYKPLTEDHDVVLNLRATGGIVTKLGKPLRIADRVLLGGGSFRGFSSGGIGPRDTVTDDAIGGCKYTVATAQVTFPLGLPKEYDIRGFAFTEWGSLWSSGEKKPPYVTRIASENFGLRGSAGAGVRWQSPLGLIRFSLSKALKKVKGDKIEVFRFMIGTEF
jgi:outer membrane protein insertion porin family